MAYTHLQVYEWAYTGKAKLGLNTFLWLLIFDAYVTALKPLRSYPCFSSVQTPTSVRIGIRTSTGTIGHVYTYKCVTSTHLRFQ